MWIDTNSARLLLKPQHALRLQRAEGTRLRAVQGTVWVTIDNDRRDIVLNAGESFVVDSMQAVVALPIGPQATLDVCGPAGHTRPARLRDQVRAWLHGLVTTGLPATTA